jgi:probable phosphoglycerate mutase
MVENATKKWPPPPRRRIYLMRHGEVDYFGPDGRVYNAATVSLNAVGRRQAEAAGRELLGAPLDRAVTSGLPRAVETAELATLGRGLTVERLPDLREIEPGRLLLSKEATPDEVQHAFLTALDGDLSRDTRFLGGESFGELLERAWPCFARLLADTGWRHLLIVAHGVVNRVLLARMLGVASFGVGAFEQDGGCLNVIDVDANGHFLVRLLNHSPLNALKHGVEWTTMERLYEQYLQRRPV